MLVLWLSAGLIAGASEAPPVAVPQGGAHPGFRRYQRRYSEPELDLERDLERVIEATHRPLSRKARKEQLGRVVVPLRDALATARTVEAPPLALADLRQLARHPDQHVATPGEWRAAVAALAMKALAEMQARRELADEDDVETLLLMAA
jgi:hypothetical protein